MIIELGSKHGKERKPSGGKKHKGGVSQSSETASSKETKKSETIDTTKAQQKNVKDIKVTPSKNETAGKVESLPQEAADKLTVSDKQTVIDKGKQEKTEETVLDITDSGNPPKDSAAVTDNKGGVTPSERNEDENSSDMTPIKRTSESEMVGTINSELDPETVANMIKSPSSQSIQRPPPDHTQQQENVLEGLAESAKPQVMFGQKNRFEIRRRYLR